MTNISEAARQAEELLQKRENDYLRASQHRSCLTRIWPGRVEIIQAAIDEARAADKAEIERLRGASTEALDFIEAVAGTMDCNLYGIQSSAREYIPGLKQALAATEGRQS